MELSIIKEREKGRLPCQVFMVIFSLPLLSIEIRSQETVSRSQNVLCRLLLEKIDDLKPQ